MTETKRCKKCERTLPLGAFGLNRSRPGGRQLYCRPCWKTYTRPYMLARRFGLNPGEYENLLEAQGGVCAICKQPPRRNYLSVDHDHSTGRIRGLLCVRCNLSVEWMIAWGQRATAYLEAQ